jgi:predicted secreted protein
MRVSIPLLVIVLILLGTSLIFAGDIARFVNLGFSSDNRYFMFAQYGVKEGNHFPYADLFVVDVPTNRFASRGVKHAVYDSPAEPGNNGEGALYSLFGKSLSLVQRYGISHLRTGRILYLLIDGEKPEERLDFRDFLTSSQYKVRLTQSARGTGKNVRSSFFIDLTVISKSGALKTFTVGLPDYERKGVKRYRIRQILLSPNGNSLVFIIEKEEADTGGVNIRYMIETVKIR